LQFWSLSGLHSYESIRELQLQLVELRYRDLIPDTVLFLEHTPVITRGRGLQYTGQARPKHMPLLQLLPEGISFSESERGGDLTYHGPGQWVVYPICKLDGQGFGPHHDVAGFLRRLELIFIEELVGRGLSAEAKDNATGVWVGTRKIASIGIAIRKWVSYHGVALNCVNDLKPFYLISPCGFNPEVMTRLSDCLELGPSWREELELAVAKRMSDSPEVMHLSLQDAQANVECHLAHLEDREALCESLGLPEMHRALNS